MGYFNVALDIEDVLNIAEPLQLPIANDEGGLMVFGKVGPLKRFLGDFAVLISDECAMSYIDAYNALAEWCEASLDPAGGDTVRYFWHGISVA